MAGSCALLSRPSPSGSQAHSEPLRPRTGSPLCSRIEQYYQVSAGLASRLVRAAGMRPARSLDTTGGVRAQTPCTCGRPGGRTSSRAGDRRALERREPGVFFSGFVSDSTSVRVSSGSPPPGCSEDVRRTLARLGGGEDPPGRATHNHVLDSAGCDRRGLAWWASGRLFFENHVRRPGADCLPNARGVSYHGIGSCQAAERRSAPVGM